MKKLSRIMFLFLTCAMLALFACDDDSSSSDGGTTTSWQTIYEDNFDSGTLNTTYLEIIDGADPTFESGAIKLDEHSGTIAYKTELDGRFRVSISFTLKNASNDAEVGIYINFDGANNAYWVGFDQDSPDPYNFFLYKLFGGSGSELDSSEMTTPPSVDQQYQLIAEFDNGLLTGTLLDSSGEVIKSITTTDNSIISGKVGFNGETGDYNVTSHYVLFDNFKIEVPQ